LSPDGRPAKLVVVGQGYVGLPLALRAVEVGFDVVGFDLAVDRIKQLADGDSYVEDISDHQLAAALAGGRYRPTDDPAHMVGFDVAVIDVPTPLQEGNPNLSFVEDAASTLSGHLRPGATVIL
jgi:UDP-N-acetyl-D-mannosaminuronic acid dehydrogenase/UDP-N-acetyl-D-glucosamine dehydrogenase